jgi:hypothetical protein
MRKAALAAGGMALVLALSGCGGDGSGGGSASEAPLFSNAQELVRAASAKTEQVQTAKFTYEMSMLGQQMTGKGEGRFAGGDTAMSMTVDMMGMSMEMRMLDGVIYMKMPQQLAQSTGGQAPTKPWMKVSAGDNAAMAQAFEQAEQSDPRKTLELIEQSGKITKSERTQLGGQDVTHYWAELDLAKSAGQMPGGMPAEVMDQLKGVDTTIPVELWLNSDQLPVKMTMDMSAFMKAVAEQSGGAPAGQDLGGKISMEYSDWGAPVNIEAPPADQVGDLSEMMPN